MTLEHSFCRNCEREYTSIKITSAFCSDGCEEAYYHFRNNTPEIEYDNPEDIVEVKE